MINILKRIKSNKELKNVSNNFLSLSVLQVLNTFLPLLILPFLVRKLGLENFGLLIFSQAFVTYFSIIIDYGFNISATREISTHKKDKEYISKVFYSVFFIQMCLLIISIILVTLIIFSFELFKENYLLHYITFSMIIGQMLFPTWYFQGVENMKIVVILHFITRVIYTFLIFLLIDSENDLLYVAGLNSITILLAGICSFYLSSKELKYSKLDLSYIIPFFKESSTVFISNFFSRLYSVTNSFLLGIFTNNLLVGIYSSFEKIINGLKGLYSPLLQALFPYLSRKEDKKNIIKNLILPIGLSGFIMMLVSYTFSDFFINLIFSDKTLLANIQYFNYMTIIPFLASINMLFNFLYLNSMKLYKERAIVMVSAGILNLIMSLILLYLNFEILSVVLSYIFVEIFLLIIGYYFYSKSK
jgi:polysaccharide transporter, PST family